jgi:hypothetical protein
MKKANDLTLAEVRAMYFDDDALMISPTRLFRYHNRNERFYFYLKEIPDEIGEMKKIVKIAIGTTTITGATIPSGESLMKYYADKGWDDAIAYRDERSKYGSLMHTCCANLIIDKSFDLDKIPEIVSGYMAKNELDYDAAQWSADLKSDVLAMAQFITDYNVKPLAIELSLVSEKWDVAGTLDLFCELDDVETGFFGEVYKSGDKKGQPKETKRTVRTLAIVDFKSGRKSYSNPQHVAQLIILRQLLRDMMTTVFGVEIDGQNVKLYNWHPKEWVTTPGYHLIDQSDKINVSDSEYLNGLVWHYRVHNPDPATRKSVNVSGIINIESGDYSQNVSVETILNIAQKRVELDDIPAFEYETIDDYLTVKNYPDNAPNDEYMESLKSE